MGITSSYPLEVFRTVVVGRTNEVGFLGRSLAVTTIAYNGAVTMIPTTKRLTATRYRVGERLKACRRAG
jgi:hypothetical protein